MEFKTKMASAVIAAMTLGCSAPEDHLVLLDNPHKPGTGEFVEASVLDTTLVPSDWNEDSYNESRKRATIQNPTIIEGKTYKRATINVGDRIIALDSGTRLELRLRNDIKLEPGDEAFATFNFTPVSVEQTRTLTEMLRSTQRVFSEGACVAEGIAKMGTDYRLFVDFTGIVCNQGTFADQMSGVFVAKDGYEGMPHGECEAYKKGLRLPTLGNCEAFRFPKGYRGQIQLISAYKHLPDSRLETSVIPAESSHPEAQSSSRIADEPGGVQSDKPIYVEGAGVKQVDELNNINQRDEPALIQKLRDHIISLVPGAEESGITLQFAIAANGEVSNVLLKGGHDNVQLARRSLVQAKTVDRNFIESNGFAMQSSGVYVVQL